MPLVVTKATSFWHAKNKNAQRAGSHFRIQTTLRNTDACWLLLTKLWAGASFVQLKWYKQSCCSRLCHSDLQRGQHRGAQRSSATTGAYIIKALWFCVVNTRQNQSADVSFFYSDRGLDRLIMWWLWERRHVKEAVYWKDRQVLRNKTMRMVNMADTAGCSMAAWQETKESLCWCPCWLCWSLVWFMSIFTSDMLLWSHCADLIHVKLKKKFLCIYTTAKHFKTFFS